MPVYENRGSFLLIKITEPYSLTGTFSFLQEFSERCRQEHLQKVLIDGSLLAARISIWDRYQIGREYARVVDPRIRVALVAPPRLINNVLENVVVNRRGRLKVFHEMELALEWLTLGK